MAKAAAPAPAPPPNLPPAPAPAPAGAPAPANVVQRPANLPKPTGSLEFAEPLTRTYERQYRTDFSDLADDAAAGRDIPGAAELDAAMPPADDKAPADEAKPADKVEPKVKPKAKRQSMNERTSVTPDVQAHDDAQTGTTPAATTETTETKPATTVPVMSADDRRKALKAIEGEERRRVNEQTLATERERIKDIETKLKGPLVDRLLLAFPELAGTADQKRDQLMEMLVAGSIKLPETGAPAQGEKTADQKRIEALEEKLARLDPAAPVAQDALAKARLAQVATDMTAQGVALPFSTKAGATIMVDGKPMTADDLRLQVTKATYRLQGNRGTVDGTKVVQLVEQAFEDEFTKQWGADAAAAIRGSKPAVAAPAAKVEAKPPATVQRRGNGGGRGTHGGSVGGDPLPMNRDARHRLIMNEIDQMEGTVSFGPR